MTVLADLQTALDARLTEYAAITTTHPTHSAKGVSMDHDGHRKSLLEEITQLRLLIQQEGGQPVEIRTQVLG